MTERSVTHSTWVLERTYDAPPARVFKAWAEKEAKSQWFGGSDADRWDFDFRVGGREVNVGSTPDGTVYALDALYQDIVPDERIVYSYEMKMNDDRISVSLATVQLEAAGGGTRLTLHRAGRLPRRPRHARAARGGHGLDARRARQVARGGARALTGATRRGTMPRRAPAGAVSRAHVSRSRGAQPSASRAGPASGAGAGGWEASIR